MLLRTLARGIASAGLLSQLAYAAPSKRTTENAQQIQLCNTPTDRACWASGFDINTDWEQKTPVTGVTRTFTFTVTEVPNFVGPDGQQKQLAMLINNQFPGPTIQADWGDRINVTVINNLKTNGTSFHWHGIRQLNNNIADGSNGVTECPIPPGGQHTYSFLATQYGSSWYHSHYSSQYANGLVGSILINGPSSLPFDIDLGVFPIADWYYGSADSLLSRVISPNDPFVPGAPGSPPLSDNVLFNGTNINPSGPGGQYARVKLTPGKRHRLRLINPSVENTFTISIVGHQMTVIQNDFVPVQAFTAQSLFLGIGQRYDVTIDANKGSGNFWINATFSNTNACGGSKNPHPAAILTYEGTPDGLPTDPGTPPPESRCEDLTSLVPVVQRTVTPGQFTGGPDQHLGVALFVDTAASRVFWKVNGSAMDVVWEKPTLEFVAQGNSSFPGVANVISIPETSQFSFWLIQNVDAIPHPMHLHGHDFLILGRSPAPDNPFAPTTPPTVFNAATDVGRLNLNNPARRDATMLPGKGWLAVAFQNDNPGAWLFHCHIAWHASQGLSVQFLEKTSQIPKVMDINSIQPNCDAWRKYQPTDPFPKLDSGI